MVTAAVAELRGEERVSLRAAFVLFPFFSTLVLHLLYSMIFDIYRASVLSFQLVVPCVIAWRTFLFSDFFLPAFSEEQMLLYLVLGPLSSCQGILIFDQGGTSLD